jgi:hypothetical protein
MGKQRDLTRLSYCFVIRILVLKLLFRLLSETRGRLRLISYVFSPHTPSQHFDTIQFPVQGLKEAKRLTIGVQTQKDLPLPLLTSSQPLRATLLLASFGTSPSFSNHVFNLAIKADPSAGKIKYEKPLRYGKLEEIHHIFKADPKSGPVLFSLVFFVAVVATLPLLGGVVSSLSL